MAAFDPLGIYLREVERIPPMTPTEEQRMLALAAEGDRSAEKQLLDSLLRFVADIAIRTRPKGMDPLDAVVEGNTALLQTLETWPRGDLHAAIRNAIERTMDRRSQRIGLGDDHAVNDAEKSGPREVAAARDRLRETLDETRAFGWIDLRGTWRRPPDDGGASVRELRKPRSPNGSGTAHLDIPHDAP